MDVPVPAQTDGISRFQALGVGTDLGVIRPMKIVEITLALAFVASIAVVALSVMAGNVAI